MVAYQPLEPFVEKAEVNLAVRTALLALEAPPHAIAIIESSLALLELHVLQNVPMIQVDPNTTHDKWHDMPTSASVSRSALVEPLLATTAGSFSIDQEDTVAASVTSSINDINELYSSSFVLSPSGWRPSLRHKASQTTTPIFAKPRKCRVYGRTTQTSSVCKVDVVGSFTSLPSTCRLWVLRLQRFLACLMSYYLTGHPMWAAWLLPPMELNHIAVEPLCWSPSWGRLLEPRFPLKCHSLPPKWLWAALLLPPMD